jgi:HEAT repeat protein
MAKTAHDKALNDRLWELVADEEVDSTVRIELAETLGKLGREKEAAALLLAMGLNTKLRYVDQRDAFAALGRVGYADSEILEQVRGIAQTTDRKFKDFVRLAAAYALEGLGERALSIQCVLQLVADKSIYRSTRHDAFTLVGEAGFSGIEALDEATVAILRVWSKEENTTEDIRERAIESLTMLGVSEREFVQDLISIMQNKREYRRVRQKAAWALGALPQEWAGPVCEGLQAVLYDPDEKNDVLRVEIARSLLKFIEEQPAVDYLKAVTEQAYMAQARHDAAMVLLEEDMVEDAIEPHLLMVLTPEIADFLRQSAVHALGGCAVGNQEVIEGLQRVLEQPELEPNVRQETYYALMAIASA